MFMWKQNELKADVLLSSRLQPLVGLGETRNQQWRFEWYRLIKCMYVSVYTFVGLDYSQMHNHGYSLI